MKKLGKWALRIISLPFAVFVIIGVAVFDAADYWVDKWFDL